MIKDFSTRVIFPSFEIFLYIGGFWINPKHIIELNEEVNDQQVNYMLRFKYRGDTSSILNKKGTSVTMNYFCDPKYGICDPEITLKGSYQLEGHESFLIYRLEHL